MEETEGFRHVRIHSYVASEIHVDYTCIVQACISEEMVYVK